MPLKSCLRSKPHKNQRIGMSHHVAYEEEKRTCAGRVAARRVGEGIEPPFDTSDCDTEHRDEGQAEVAEVVWCSVGEKGHTDNRVCRKSLNML